MHTESCDTATLVERITAEYREMPGLSLTIAQAERVWHLDRPQCAAILESLVAAKVLTRTRTGAFVRVG